MFVYKHRTCQKVAYSLRKTQTLRVNNSIIVRIKNAKFLGYYSYTNTNIKGDFQVYVSVPLKQILRQVLSK